MPAPVNLRSDDDSVVCLTSKWSAPDIRWDKARGPRPLVHILGKRFRLKICSLFGLAQKETWSSIPGFWYFLVQPHRAPSKVLLEQIDIGSHPHIPTHVDANLQRLHVWVEGGWVSFANSSHLTNEKSTYFYADQIRTTSMGSRVTLI